MATTAYDLRAVFRQQDRQRLSHRRVLLAREIAACADAFDFADIRDMLDELDTIEAELADLADPTGERTSLSDV